MNFIYVHIYFYIYFIYSSLFIAFVLDFLILAFSVGHVTYNALSFPGSLNLCVSLLRVLQDGVCLVDLSHPLGTVRSDAIRVMLLRELSIHHGDHNDRRARVEHEHLVQCARGHVRTVSGGRVYLRYVEGTGGATIGLISSCCAVQAVHYGGGCLRRVAKHQWIERLLRVEGSGTLMGQGFIR